MSNQFPPYGETGFNPQEMLPQNLHGQQQGGHEVHPESNEANLLNNFIEMIDEKLYGGVHTTDDKNGHASNDEDEEYHTKTSSIPKIDSKKSPKKRKRGRDPKKPRRSMGPFIFFANEQRQKFKEVNPDMKVTEVTAKLAEIWRSMTPEEKIPYQELAERDKMRFKEEMSEYVPPRSDSSDESDSDSDRQQKKKKKKSKKKKKRRDPNKPKRPMSPFIFFVNHQRPSVRSEHPDWKITEITKKLAEDWREMSDEQKKQYQDMCEIDKARFKEEIDKYVVPSDSSDGESSNNDDTKKKKVKKSSKDPNRPKRPMSAFLHFTRAKRPRLREKYPDVKLTDIVKKLADIWNRLDDKKKEKYIKLADRDKERYKKDMNLYAPNDEREDSPSSAIITSSDSDDVDIEEFSQTSNAHLNVN